jgi:predicted RecB family nuclease
MHLPDDFIFSQSSLQDYLDCPRRFELRHLRRQAWPAPAVDDLLEFERHTSQGEQFHRLVHQHLIGLPADTLRSYIDDADVRRWFETYLARGLDDVPEQRHPETALTVPLGDYWLLAKFDLLALEPGRRALIIDWKTARRLPRRETLARRMQTVVYRYVLAQGGAVYQQGQPIAPEQIEMIYWYADQDGAALRFPYDPAQFAADDRALRELVREIETRAEFPLTDDPQRCRFCVYRSLCDRGAAAGDLQAWDTDSDAAIDFSDLDIGFDQIEEIEY